MAVTSGSSPAGAEIAALHQQLCIAKDLNITRSQFLYRGARTLERQMLRFINDTKASKGRYHGQMRDRAPSPDLAPNLEALGFRIDQEHHHKATLRLQSGIFLELDPDEHCTWRETEGVSLGLANPGFAAVMGGWTPEISGPLAALDARKRRQDTAGFMLWSGHLPFAEFPAPAATPMLGLYDQAMPLEQLVEHLVKAASAKALAKDVFGGALAPCVMPTEGLWVYLFLMMDAGCACAEILEDYIKLRSEGATFGTRNHLTLDAIDAYFALYQTRMDGRR